MRYASHLAQAGTPKPLSEASACALVTFNMLNQTRRYQVRSCVHVPCTTTTPASDP